MKQKIFILWKTNPKLIAILILLLYSELITVIALKSLDYIDWKNRYKVLLAGEIQRMIFVADVKNDSMENFSMKLRNYLLVQKFMGSKITNTLYSSAIAITQRISL